MNFIQEAKAVLLDIILSLLAWVFFAPLALIIPKKSCGVVVLGRQNGQFLDNAKYFFRYGAESGEHAADLVFLTADRSLCNEINGFKGKAAIYPSVCGAWILLRARVVVYDSVDWVQSGRYQLSFFSRKVQLWHGAPLKQIELPLHQKRLERLALLKRWALAGYKLVTARYAQSDLLISTSRYFTRNAFSEAFNSKDILESGYPRNDILCEKDITNSETSGLLELNTDTQAISRIEQARKAGKKIVIYMPTFRMDRHNPFDNGVLDIERLESFSKDSDVFLVFKFHPLMEKYCNLENIDNIVQYDSGADVYPALLLCDCLVTDYSSIYFDYLYVDRPIIFFPYDYAQYTTDDRQLLFDYDEMTPGKKCYSQKELEQAMCDVLSGVDDYKKSRRIVFEKVFDREGSGASAQIWDYIKTNYFI